jgi:hypothetical protein
MPVDVKTQKDHSKHNYQFGTGFSRSSCALVVALAIPTPKAL